jgi:hypothetical protein
MRTSRLADEPLRPDYADARRRCGRAPGTAAIVQALGSRIPISIVTLQDNEQLDRLAAGEIQRLVQQSEVEGNDERIGALPEEHS